MELIGYLGMILTVIGIGMGKRHFLVTSSILVAASMLLLIYAIQMNSIPFLLLNIILLIVTSNNIRCEVKEKHAIKKMS
jgi:membrane protein implicated in regulation of membrane protease activity